MVKNLFSKYKSLLLIIISSFIIITIYREFKWLELLKIIKEANIYFLSFGAFISILLGYVCSIRYSYFSSKIFSNNYPRITTSVKSYFIASSFNLLLPSKLGDLSKGFLAQRLDNKKYPQSLHIFTLYEKASDLFALLFIGLIFSIFIAIKNSLFENSNNILISVKLNLIFLFIVLSLLISLFFLLAPLIKFKIPKYFAKNIPKVIIEIFNFKNKFDWKNFYYLQLLSCLIWIIHIIQMLFFSTAIGISLWNPSGIFILIFSVLIGLLPLSFAGIGTRDASIVFFLAPSLGNTKPLILGILLTTRYLIPAVIGLIFFKDLKGTK